MTLINSGKARLASDIVILWGVGVYLLLHLGNNVAGDSDGDIWFFASSDRVVVYEFQ